MSTKNLENFQKLISKEESGWLDKFLYYKANQKWLDYSMKIAVNVLEALAAKKMSQKELAKKMNVSAQQVNKIVKGKQNLTFETISKLEDALEISLIEIINCKSINGIKTEATEIKAHKKTGRQEIIAAKSFSEDFKKKEGVAMKVVYNINNQYTNYPIAK